MNALLTNTVHSSAPQSSIVVKNLLKKHESLTVALGAMSPHCHKHVSTVVYFDLVSNTPSFSVVHQTCVNPQLKIVPTRPGISSFYGQSHLTFGAVTPVSNVRSPRPSNNDFKSTEIMN